MTIDEMVQNLLGNSALRQVVYYATPDSIVKLTKQGRQKVSDRRKIFVLTSGKPNSREREFIKKQKKAGAQFPLKDLQLKYFPQRSK